MFFVQAFLGYVMIGITDTTATEVIHSSFASATWLVLVTLASLVWTTAAGRVGAAGERSQATQPPVQARSYG
jgi:uncharacterized membrane protein YadS